MIAAGVDVGRKHDRTALVMIRDGEVSDIAIPPLGPIQEQAAALVPFVKLADCTAIDATGVGIGLVDLLMGYVGTVPVTITHRIAPTINGATLLVGKLWLMGRLHRAIRDREVTVSPSCAHACMLKGELECMVAKHMPSGGIKVEARAGHDDLVLALALALLARDMLTKGYRHGTAKEAA